MTKLLIKTRVNLKEISEKMKHLDTKTTKDISNQEWIKEMTKSRPIIELQKIIIGYRQSKNYNKVKKGLEDGFLNKQGFQVIIEPSALSNAFEY